MDNELEVINNEAVLNTAEVITEPSVLKTVAPIAGGVVIGIGIGYALCRWVISPLIAKNKTKKDEKKAAEAEEPKTEE